MEHILRTSLLVKLAFERESTIFDPQGRPTSGKKGGPFKELYRFLKNVLTHLMIVTKLNYSIYHLEHLLLKTSQMIYCKHVPCKATHEEFVQQRFVENKVKFDDAIPKNKLKTFAQNNIKLNQSSASVKGGGAFSIFVFFDF